MHESLLYTQTNAEHRSQYDSFIDHKRNNLFLAKNPRDFELDRWCSGGFEHVLA